MRKGRAELRGEELCKRVHNMTLRDYLRRETNRGVKDTELAREFGVHRHTIRNWRRHFNLVLVTRVVSTRTNEKDTE